MLPPRPPARCAPPCCGSPAASDPRRSPSCATTWATRTTRRGPTPCAASRAWGYRVTGAEADLVRRLLRDEVAAATSLTQAQIDLAPLGGADEAVALLGRALERALRGHQIRACLLLALLYDAATLLRV